MLLERSESRSSASVFEPVPFDDKQGIKDKESLRYSVVVHVPFQAASFLPFI